MIPCLLTEGEGTEAGVWYYSHFLDLSSVDEVSGSLSDNLGWVDEVLEDLLVDGSQRSVSWSLLGGSGSSAWLLEDSSLGDEDDMTVREFLLELSGQSLLNLVERFEQRDWDEDDDSLLASTDLDLSCSRDLQRSKVSLQIGDGRLEIVKRLSDGELGLIAGCLCEFRKRRHD